MPHRRSAAPPAILRESAQHMRCRPFPALLSTSSAVPLTSQGQEEPRSFPACFRDGIQAPPLRLPPPGGDSRGDRPQRQKEAPTHADRAPPGEPLHPSQSLVLCAAVLRLTLQLFAWRPRHPRPLLAAPGSAAPPRHGEGHRGAVPAAGHGAAAAERVSGGP